MSYLHVRSLRHCEGASGVRGAESLYIGRGLPLVEGVQWYDEVVAGKDAPARQNRQQECPHTDRHSFRPAMRLLQRQAGGERRRRKVPTLHGGYDTDIWFVPTIVMRRAVDSFASQRGHGFRRCVPVFRQLHMGCVHVGRG